MYQPALRPDQVQALYYLKQQRRRPMTRLLREAVDHYLEAFDGQQGETLRGEVESRRKKTA